MSRRRGSAVYTAIALVAIMSTIALALTGAFTLSLNFTNGYTNQELAQSEAEAALAELLARLAETPSYGMSGNETIRGTATPGLNERHAFHILTFDRGQTDFAFSTNATGGGGPAPPPLSGSLGRPVPSGTIHAVATGYCRGQYCTLEAVIENPPFPYGLATSGPVRSPASPLVVKGVSNLAAWQNTGQDDRPGHVFSNSTDGVRIGVGPDPTKHTYVSGFVRSVGTVSIDQPATVLGGIRSGAPSLDLPVIDLEQMRNSGQIGVALVVDRNLPSQILDIAYYCNDDVYFNGPVEMRNAFVFSERSITINGGLRGVGAIVALGDVILNGDSALSASDHVALLARGKITIRGSGNYFTGIVFSETGIDAKNLTVAGNVIANSPLPNQGSADLEQVTILSTQNAGLLSFTVNSVGRSDVTHTAGGQLPFVLDPGGFPGAGVAAPDDFLPPAMRTPQQITQTLQASFDSMWNPSMASPGAALGTSFNGSIPISPGAEHVLAAFEGAFNAAATASSLQGDLDQVEAAISALGPDPGHNSHSSTSGNCSGCDWEDDKNRLEAEKSALEGAIAAQKAIYDQMKQDSIRLYNEYVATHTDSNGAYNEGGAMEMNQPI
ncbi:MAG: hypothetical protein AB1758_23255, partial [Candidatus Eremiobacterota bacterium]